MEKIKVNALLLNQPTINNRVYSKECLERAVIEFQKQIKEDRGFVYHGDPSLNNAVGLVSSVEIKDKALLCEITSLPNKEKIIEGLINGSLVARPSGFGTVSADGVVNNDYVLTHFNIGKKDE